MLFFQSIFHSTFTAPGNHSRTTIWATPVIPFAASASILFIRAVILRFKQQKCQQSKQVGKMSFLLTPEGRGYLFLKIMVNKFET